MKTFIYWLLACLLVLCSLTVGLGHVSAREATTCDGWANFGKTMTYKYRDTGVHQATVRKAVLSVMSDDPELLTALRYIDYIYTNSNMTDSQVWLGIYEECKLKATL